MNGESNTGLLTSNKFKSFPVVNSTTNWLTESYSKLKETNFVTKCTCGLAESTLKNSMYLATPLVNKFKDQVCSLDTIAYNQLERLETAFPIIKSEPEALVTQSKELINKTVQPVSSRVENFKTNTKATCDSVKSCLPKSIPGQNLANRLLDMSQKLLEQYLIYADLEQLRIEDESPKEYISYYENEKQCQALIKRIKVLTYVFYASLKENLMNKARLVLDLLTVKFAKLYAFMSWFDSYKTSLLNKTKDKMYLTKDKIDLYKEYLDVLSKQFTVQDGRSLHHVHSLEDRTKIIIRRSLGNMIAAFHLAYSKVSNTIPIVQTRFKAMGQFTTDLYQIYNKHDGSFNEMLVEIILREVSELTYKTQLSANILIKKLNNSEIVSWFVPNFETFGVLDYDFEDFTINNPRSTLDSKTDEGSSEDELINAFSPQFTYSSEFSPANSGHSTQNNNSNSCYDMSNIYGQ